MTIQITPLAHEKIAELIESKGELDLALRVAIQGRGPGGFIYQLKFVEVDSSSPGDITQDEGDFKVFIDPESAPNLEGSTLDFVEDINERGFKLENPNPLWSDPLSLKIQDVMDAHINPQIAAHGGYVSLLDVRDSVAYVELGGGCVGCGLADVTLKQGIEVMLLEAVPEISAVVDTTDHASGTNPYFRPAKGGQSPFSQ
ncbi:MAG: iron-sulfur cluster assembly accessory protein [Anaerolineales bacterium]|nr:iron-sulfur cluster assembly accessory protein [Anaerolineales bacterium]